MARRKLLLADDSITIQKVVNLTFADEGIDVSTVSDGDSAMQHIGQEAPDIVLADINMPGLNGYQVCERVRSDERTSHIPVILLVGAFEHFDEAEASRVGASAHLTKPFQSIRQLIIQVTDLIESTRQAPEPAPASEPAPMPEHDAVRIDPFQEPIAAKLESFREDRIASIDQEREALSIPAEIGPHEQLPSGQEPEDIDQLYRQSIGAEAASGDDELPDLGVDDEMIETSYTAPQPSEQPVQLNEDFDFDNTVYQRPADPNVQESLPQPHESAEAVLGEPSISNETVPASPPQDRTVRLDPAMVEAKMAEENRRYEQSTQPAPIPQAAIGEDTIRMDSRFDTRGSGTYEFDDTDLLDIPVGTEVEVTSPADAATRGGKQVVTLSPELIEMIAQRVVEKLAERH